MITCNVTARTCTYSAAQVLETEAGRRLNGHVSALLANADGSAAAGICGLTKSAPIIQQLFAHPLLNPIFENVFESGKSLLIEWNEEQNDCNLYKATTGKCDLLPVPEEVKEAVRTVMHASEAWGGVLNDDGEHTVDLKSPMPGVSFYTNMLIGNRMGFDRPLQSTPKSVVDRFGGGSFRSHADTQVLATRWDYRPQENGHPANRQFYLVENGKVVFFSGSASQPSVGTAGCRHSQNHTVITYKTACGLKITRKIFILPQYKGLPLATEAQLITVENTGSETRRLRIVPMGMFGTPAAHALQQDVIYSTVICQSNVYYDENGYIAAVGYDYNPKQNRSDIRFHTSFVHQGNKCVLPDRFCFRYEDLVGSGTLENPEHAAALPSSHTRKGPGFFAVSAPFTAAPGETVEIDSFTGLVSGAVDAGFDPALAPRKQIGALIETFRPVGALENALGDVRDFCRQYASYLNVKTQDKNLNTYFNRNLPFQVFYQTFVSRAFDQTQKGYRELGFREIQDIYASMYYFVGMGRGDYVKSLLKEWICNVYDFGYANHNFYWQGKEPGLWSDDALWLVQAVERYVSLTGDAAILDEVFPTADGSSRTLTETIRAIVTYSSTISTGKHGLPLIDLADWNDCLRVDPDCLSGPEKEKRYAEQLKNKGQSFGSPLENDFSESVMNGFLLKVAVDAAKKLFALSGKELYANEYASLSAALAERLIQTSWKGDFFARVLFNRGPAQYLGAKGDGLSVESGAKGVYFLNSFSWSVLADVADDSMIETMLNTLDNNLRTPYGYRLCSSADYSVIAPKIDIDLYYPGDRENGGVFKHANMMAASAMLKAANAVKEEALARRLTDTAWWLIDCIVPYRTLNTPFESCGNPRFCTQYNNSETGENMPPTLSGTSSWLLLSLMSAFGLEIEAESIRLTPLLRESDSEISLTLKIQSTVLQIHIQKGTGFKRLTPSARILLDGQELAGRRIPISKDIGTHKIEVTL